MKDKRCGLAIYEHAAGVLARVEEGAGMRTALYEHQMPNAVRPSVLALVCETLKSKERLETALKETTINTGLSTNDRCMTLVLTFELAVRGGTIKGGAKSALVRAVFEQKAALIALLGGPGPVAPAAPRQKLPRYVRVNTLRTSVEVALEHLEKEDGLQRLDGLAAPDEAAAAPLWRKGAVVWRHLAQLHVRSGGGLSLINKDANLGVSVAHDCMESLLLFQLHQSCAFCLNIYLSAT